MSIKLANLEYIFFQLDICKYFYPLDVVVCGSETQLEVG